MTLIPLKLPPGVVRGGTEYASKGRWYDSQLMRWADGALRSVDGWTVREAEVATSPVRAVLVVPNTVGSQAGDLKVEVYASAAGVRMFTDYPFDEMITPAGVGTVTNGLWSLDMLGQILLAAAAGTTGKTLYVLDLASNPTGVDLAAVTGTNIPANVRGVVVTPEQFVTALCPERRVQWADQDSVTDWDYSDTTNQAGYFDLPTKGKLLAGRRARQETLLWTTQDVWAMRYIGGDLIYSFQQLGEACGAASINSMAVIGTNAIWMGDRSFYTYDGFVKPLPCDVADYLFNDIDEDRLALVHAVANPKFNEVWWFYPSNGALDCDSYVTFNFVTGEWTLGKLPRTAGTAHDNGLILCGYSILENPSDSAADSHAYNHEVGTTYEETLGTLDEFSYRTPTIIEPFIESGPIELGDGEQWVTVQRVLADVLPLQAAGLGPKITFTTAHYPDDSDSEETYGPYQLVRNLPVLLTGRQFRVRIESDTYPLKIGVLRLEVARRGKR